MTIHLVHFFGPINQLTCDRTMDACLKAHTHGASEIRFHFSSDGGSTFHGFTLFNFIRSLPIPVAMHNVGNIESIAVIVYLAASRRLTCNSSRFLIHPLHYGFGNAPSADHLRLLEWGRALNSDAERYVELFNQQTHGASQPIQVRDHLFGHAAIIDGATAVSGVVAHEICDAKIPEGAATWWVSAS